MPEQAELRLLSCDGWVLVTCGRSLVYRYEVGDTGMRNLAIVALTDAGRRVDEAAAVFGLTATYVSMLRGRARRDGSAGLVRRRGRPPKLTGRQVAQARVWAGQGWTQQAIGDRFAVAQSVISELLARLGPALVQEALPEPGSTGPDDEPATAEPADTEPAGPAGAGLDEVNEPVVDEPAAASGMTPPGSGRVAEGSHRSRYAGAMLLYGYLHGVGAEGIFATLTGGPARRYDDLAVLTTATLGFALGFDRGGAYPSAFTACRAAGADWVTYRRAPLVKANAEPRRSWTLREGKRIRVLLADA